MTLWLECREKMQEHDTYVKWRLDDCPPIVSSELYPAPSSRVIMTKHPSRKAVPFEELRNEYSAPFIEDALARFIVRHNNPTWTKAQIEASANDVDLPFRTLPVYHHAKFWLGDTGHYRLLSTEMDTVYAIHARKDKLGRPLAAEFDTVLVNDGSGEYIGVAGEQMFL